jgi:hypothetical protein
MFGLATWRSSKARAYAPNFGLHPQCFDRVAPIMITPSQRTHYAVPAGTRRVCAAPVCSQMRLIGPVLCKREERDFRILM